MPPKKKQEHPLSKLADYIPEGSFDPVVQYLNYYKVALTVTQSRKAILGDYRNANRGERHKISVNGNLNKYSFLITLLHELAHLLTFEQYGNRVASHGKEWKSHYSQLLQTFVSHQIFPADIMAELKKSIRNPAATCGGETDLMRVLRKYDPIRDSVFLLEELPLHAHFLTRDGKLFEKGEQLRKRFRCKELKTGLIYLISPIYEVKYIRPSNI